MNVSEISGGAPFTVEVRSLEGAFDPLPREGDEVVLVRSEGRLLLSADAGTWAVEGVTAASAAAATELAAGGPPVVAFVAQARAGHMVIEARRFPQELRLTEPLEIGLDDKVQETLRERHRVNGTVSDVSAWLEESLMILATPPTAEVGLRRLVISADPRGTLEGFRIYGRGIAADIRRVQGRLRIERVVKGGRSGRGKTRLCLLRAPVSIVDATVAAELHGAVRTVLAAAVATEGSYLRVWQDYQRAETELVQRRARAFGALEYEKSERQRDGSRRFHLVAAESVASQLAALHEQGVSELEAVTTPPALGAEGEAEPRATAQRSRTRRERPLSARVQRVDERATFIDLAPPDGDGEQPTPPERGFLVLSQTGDRARLQRRERAVEALRTGNCPLPQLGLLMEGRPAPAARRTHRGVDSPLLKKAIGDVFAGTKPTPRQLEAIERALNTPDVCLIQGPPGTGKTKVITAIERCLAVLADEGAELSHRVLVAAAQHDAVENVVRRTEVFGLPAIKVGRRRRGSDTAFDPVQAFADEKLGELRARTRAPSDAERLSRAYRMAVACLAVGSLPAEQSQRLHELVEELDELLPPQLRDRALERAAALLRPGGAGDPEEIELMVRAARSIRVDDVTFSDDGPLQACKALARLDPVLEPVERTFLERCAAAPREPAPGWLREGRPIQDGLLDRLTRPAPVQELRWDDETQDLLTEMFDTVCARRAGTRTGADAAVAAYLDDLESDPEGLRAALAHYTVVLASTLQHAAGRQMRGIRGVDVGQVTFESVIVDEAARANPLDLFIPLSMARRRVVLVGDHRQLPHLLEPEVETELSDGVERGSVERETLDAVRGSLFERLWDVLRALEARDGIRRTVTLDAQYRMPPEHGEFLSREFYEARGDGRILSPRSASEFRHDLPGYVGAAGPCVAGWIDVPARWGAEVRGASKSRPVEARVVAEEVLRLIEHDPQLTFGVIAFYAAQVDEIGAAMRDVGLAEPANNSRGWRVAERWATTLDARGRAVERLRVGTVDAFQGKEFDVVFLSVTRSNDLPGTTEQDRRRKYGHLMLENRLCVAMSRQQRLLVTVGDLDFVEAAEPLSALRAYAELCRGDHGVVR